MPVDSRCEYLYINSPPPPVHVVWSDQFPVLVQVSLRSELPGFVPVARVVLHAEHKVPHLQ